MKKFLIGLAVVVALFGVVSCSVVSTAIGVNNGIVQKDQAADAAWGQVENVYQRRNDLIPNLVQTVKGYANHEMRTLVDTIAARASATKVTINPENAQQFAQFQKNQGEISSALSRLMVVSEQYPNLKADQQFINLQSQLEGTENRISVERGKYNATVQDYNTYIATFPNSFVASFRGFQKREYFKADEGAKTAPKVDFSTPAPVPLTTPVSYLPEATSSSVASTSSTLNR